MLKEFFNKVGILFRDQSLRKRILFVLFIFAAFRLLSTIPIPGVDPAALSSFVNNNQFFGLLNIFSGGALSQLSIVMLGVGPYITASIIMQLLTVMVPQLKEMYHHEGEVGRKKFSQISRYLTIPIAAIQGIGLLLLLTQQGILTNLGIAGTLINVLIVIAGSLLVTWLGELITEFGISNGVSLIIFGGIVASIPTQIGQFALSYDSTQLPLYLGLLFLTFVIIAGIIAVTEAERPIPVVYAKQSRGGQTYGGTSTYIPLRINQAGVMPIIFALSILLFPQMIANFMVNASSVGLQNIGQFITQLLANGWFYSIFYFVLVFVFTFFYTAITFEPESMAENLQKSGAFIPGVRPGKATTDFISTIANRITLVGALFLGIIAVVPVVIQSATGMQSFAIGGTSLLIVVSVVIDMVKKMDAQISMRQY